MLQEATQSQNDAQTGKGISEKAIYGQTGVSSRQLKEVFGDNAGKVIETVDRTANKFAGSMLVSFGGSVVGGASWLGYSGVGLAGFFIAAAAGAKGFHHLGQNRAVGNITKKVLGLR